MWSFDPFKIIIVGLDVPIDETNKQFVCDRATKPVSPSFVAKIRERGIRQPVEITSLGDGIPICVAGRKRILAMRIIWDELRAEGVDEKSFPRVPCLDAKGTPLEMVIDMIAENEGREPDTPINQAKKMQLMLELKAPIEKVAEVYDRKPQTCKKIMSLLSLHEDAQALVEEGELPWTAAIDLLDVPYKEQGKRAKEIVETGGASKVAKAKEVTKGKRKPPGARLVKSLIERMGADRVEAQAIAWARGLIGDDEVSTFQVTLKETQKELRKKPAKKRRSAKSKGKKGS